MSYLYDTTNAQFENVNSLRRYPFSAGSSLVDVDGKALPEDVIVDVHLVVPSFVSPGSDSSSDAQGPFDLPDVRLTSVHLTPYMVSACFVSRSSGGNVALSATVGRSEFVPYMPCRLECLAGSRDAGGIVTFGDFEFPGFEEAYRLESACVSPCCFSSFEPPRLRRFIDRRSGETLSGEVQVAFSGYVNATRSGNSVHLKLADGAAEELVTECEKYANADVCGATPLSSINGIRPDVDGNIVLWFH